MRLLTGIVVLLLSAALGSILYAQYPMTPPAHDEPGLYAFYYPNNDVLYDGVPTPAATGYIGATVTSAVVNWLSPVLFGGRARYAQVYHHPKQRTHYVRLQPRGHQTARRQAGRAIGRCKFLKHMHPRVCLA